MLHRGNNLYAVVAGATAGGAPGSLVHVFRWVPGSFRDTTLTGGVDLVEGVPQWVPGRFLEALTPVSASHAKGTSSHPIDPTLACHILSVWAFERASDPKP